ncbi:MAG: hypothetical protein WEC34_08770 [Acidimicrobiia bacterium]
MKHRTFIAVGLLVLVVAIPLRGLFGRPGPPMEEGFMLVFGESFLRGDVPNVDFLHLYGPGGVWVLSGVFELFGVSLVAERIVGLLQIAGIIAGVFLLAWPWGRKVALSGAVVTALVIIPPIGLTALAWDGGIALGLLGIAAGLGAIRATTDRGRHGLAITAGVLLGAALLYRPDLVLAVALAGFFLVRAASKEVRVRLLVSFGAVLSLFLVHFAMAGIGDSIQGMVIDPVFNLRGGRRLPLPPSWDHFDGFLVGVADDEAIHWPIPHLRGPAQLTVWCFLLLGSVAALAATAWRVRRREPLAFRGIVLAAVAGFAIGILPQALQRPDPTHLAWVSCVPFGFAPVVAWELVRSWRPSLSPTRAFVFGCIPTIAILFLVVPSYLVRDYVDVSLESFDVSRKSHAIEHDGRTFYYGNQQAADELARLLPVADRIARPGDRLVVGTGDLRKTPLSEAFLYYLLPKTRPGTYYIEMDPGVANADDSRLADDLEHADLVILSRVWDEFHEPNDSRELGSSKPNTVLRKRFCTVLDLPLYELLERCDRQGAPSEP